MTDMKRKARPRGTSDTTLLSLCRRVVTRQWHGECAFHGSQTPCEGTVEHHHIVRRRVPHLRYDPRNGILLCQAHHNLAKYEAWRTRIRKAIGPSVCNYLDETEQQLFPVFLASWGMTRAEYLRGVKSRLEAMLRGK